MMRFFKTVILLWSATFFCLVPFTGFEHGSAFAQVQGLQGSNILPLEKKMCQKDKKLYELGERLEIGGKMYICVSIGERMAWALVPTLIRSEPL